MMHNYYETMSQTTYRCIDYPHGSWQCCFIPSSLFLFQDENAIIWDLNLPFMSSLVPPITSQSKNDVSFLISAVFVAYWTGPSGSTLIFCAVLDFSFCRICSAFQSEGEELMVAKVIVNGFPL